jgi:hypothetical protein
MLQRCPASRVPEIHGQNSEPSWEQRGLHCRVPNPATQGTCLARRAHSTNTQHLSDICHTSIDFQRGSSIHTSTCLQRALGPCGAALPQALAQQGVQHLHLSLRTACTAGEYQMRNAIKMSGSGATMAGCCLRGGGTAPASQPSRSMHSMSACMQRVQQQQWHVSPVTLQVISCYAMLKGWYTDCVPTSLQCAQRQLLVKED